MATDFSDYSESAEIFINENLNLNNNLNKETDWNNKLVAETGWNNKLVTETDWTNTLYADTDWTNKLNAETEWTNELNKETDWRNELIKDADWRNKLSYVTKQLHSLDNNNNNNNNSAYMPEGYCNVSYQIGGHKQLNGNPCFIKREDTPELIYKNYKNSRKGLREVNFYLQIFDNNNNNNNNSNNNNNNNNNNSNCSSSSNSCCCIDCYDNDKNKLKKFIPMFYGFTTLTHNTITSYYMKLEDLAYPFKKASILDLKLGKKLYEKFIDGQIIFKIKHESADQDKLGFRLIGMRVYQIESNDFISFDGTSCKYLMDGDTTYKSIHQFLDNGQSIRYDVIQKIIERLKELQLWFQEQKTFKLFSASLLILYEGLWPQKVHSIGEARVDVRIVDFARAYNSVENQLEPESCYSIGQIIDTFQKLLNAKF